MNDPKAVIPTIEVHAVAPEAMTARNMAVAKMRQLDEIKRERKEAKDTLDSQLLSSQQFESVSMKLSDIKADRERLKKELMLVPTNFKLQDRIKELNKEYREIKLELSDYLLSYKEKAQQLSFFDDAGNAIWIQQSATPKIQKKK